MVKDFQYIELSFINDYEEIKKQIINTVAISILFDKGCEETILNSYLDSTQYGYTASANEKGTHLLVRITDIISGEVNWDRVPHCDCDSEKKYLLSKGDILVARTGGTTGKSFLIKSAPVNAIFASYLIRLRAKKNNLPEFISIFLNSYAFWSQISELKSGSAQPNVNAEKLKTLVIPECSPKIQKKVIQILNGEGADSNDSFVNELMTRVNSVISKLDQLESLKREFNNQQTHLQQLRQAILQEAVQGKLTKQNKDDEPASALLKRIKAEKQKLIAAGKLRKEKELPPITEEEIPFELPKGWVWCRLGEITLNIDYGTSEKAFSHGEVPVLRMGNVQNSELVFSNLKYVRRSIKDLPRLFLKNKDLIFNRTNSFELVGKCGVYYGNDGEYTLASYLIRVTLPNDFISPEFTNYYTNSKVCRETQIEPQITQQTGQANFSGSKLKHILFPLPPLSEQQRIVDKVQQLMQMVNQLEQQIEESQSQAKQLLQAVLNKAFTSKVKVYEMNENEMMVAEKEKN